MVSSRVTVAGAAPQEMVRSDRVRRVASGWAHSTCHCAGTRKSEVTPSDSMTSSVASASNGAVGMRTVVAPSISAGGMPPMPAMWNRGTLSRDTFPSSCRRAGADRGDRLHEQVQVGEHGALGPAGGARGVHDQRHVTLVDL